MSLENLPKRRLVDEVKKAIFEKEVNALSDAGYTMEAFAMSPGFSGQDIGESAPSYVAVMKLKTEMGEDFSGVEDAMVIPLENYTPGMNFGSPLISKATAEGWRIIAIYKGTKDTPSTAIVVRKRKEEK